MNHFESSEAASRAAVGQTPSIDRWSNAIAVAWQKPTAVYVEIGRLLLEAKSSLEHGQFVKMIADQLPFKEDTAQRLMAIARHPVISNTAHARYLPPSWMTLFELSKLPEAAVLAKIADGTINPGIGRREAVALHRASRKLPNTINSKIERGGAVKLAVEKRTCSSWKPPRYLKTLEDFCDLFSFGIATARDILNPEECRALLDHLLQAIRDLEPAQNEFLDNDEIECPPPVSQVLGDDLEPPEFLVRTRNPPA